MDDERIPEPEPSGALVPPPIHPPPARATAAPLPPRRRPDDALEPRAFGTRLVERALDAIDRAGDSIASAVGLR